MASRSQARARPLREGQSVTRRDRLISQTRFRAVPLGEWSEEEAEMYDLAIDTLRFMLAECSAALASASDDAEKKRLLGKQAEIVTRRRTLDPRDHDAVQRTIDESYVR